MARIKDTSVDAVKATANVVKDLVEARTRLRKVGSRYTGLCRFHQEKTPSFSVSPDRGTYYCFGCQAGGDAISFVREAESLDFVGAISGSPTASTSSSSTTSPHPRPMRSASTRSGSTRFSTRRPRSTRRLLWADSGKPVQEYLASRGLGGEVCRASSRLGLSPAGATLAKKAREKGFTARRSSHGGRARHAARDRLLPAAADVPALRPSRAVLGFRARTLREDHPLRGKYVNSAEGELFHKGRMSSSGRCRSAAVSKRTRRSSSRGTPM